MLIPAVDVVDIAFAPDDASDVWVAMRNGLVRSRDGGVVWEPIDFGLVPLLEGIEIESIALGPGGTVRLLTDAGQLSSVDGGGTWTPASDAPLRIGGLYTFVHQLHTGYLVGPALVRVHDAAAVAVILLAITGIVIWRRSPQRGGGA